METQTKHSTIFKRVKSLLAAKQYDNALEALKAIKAKYCNRHEINEYNLLFIEIKICLGDYSIRDLLNDTVEKLKVDSPEYYDSTFTFAVILDHLACGGNLQETEFWPMWQDYMLNRGYDFIFITSRSDSADLVYAVELENMNAPVLVLPDCEERVSNLWFHQSMILKLIFNCETRTYHYTRYSIVDSLVNNEFMTFLDSLVNASDTAN